MVKSLVLHVSSDAGLLKSRGELLKQHWNVVEAFPKDALEVFAEQDFDAVVICGSVESRTRKKLVDFFSAHSPSVQIIAIGTTFDSDPRVLSVPHFDPTALNETMTTALGSGVGLKHARGVPQPAAPVPRTRR